MGVGWVTAVREEGWEVAVMGVGWVTAVWEEGRELAVTGGLGGGVCHLTPNERANLSLSQDVVSASAPGYWNDGGEARRPGISDPTMA